MNFHKNGATEKGERWWSTVKDGGSDKCSWGGNLREQQVRYSWKSFISLQLWYYLAPLFHVSHQGAGEASALQGQGRVGAEGWCPVLSHQGDQGHLMKVTHSLHHDDACPHSRQECPALEVSQQTGNRKHVLQVSETEAQVSKGISSASLSTHILLKCSKSLPSHHRTWWVFKSCNWLTSDHPLRSLNAEVNLRVNSGWDPCLSPKLGFTLDQNLISKSRAWISPSYLSNEVSNHGLSALLQSICQNL